MNNKEQEEIWKPITGYMDKQYKEWLQEQTFETLATDNYNVKLLLLSEQAKSNELEATLKILKINHKLTMSVLNNEQAKNKKLVEALELALSDTCYDAETCEYKCQFAILNQCDLFKAGQALNEVNK